MAGARFNPKCRDDASKAHLLTLKKGVITDQRADHTPLASWDPECDINDSLLAGLVQLLSIEHDINIDCVFAAGYRLPQEICLSLPMQRADPTIETVKALYDSFQHCHVAAALQVLFLSLPNSMLEQACTPMLL